MVASIAYCGGVSTSALSSTASRTEIRSPALTGVGVEHSSGSTWGATVRATYSTPEADTRTLYLQQWPPGASCPVPSVRTACGRLVREARTYSTEAPGQDVHYVSAQPVASESSSSLRRACPLSRARSAAGWCTCARKEEEGSGVEAGKAPHSTAAALAGRGEDSGRAWRGWRHTTPTSSFLRARRTEPTRCWVASRRSRRHGAPLDDRCEAHLGAAPR